MNYPRSPYNPSVNLKSRAAPQSPRHGIGRVSPDARPTVPDGLRLEPARLTFREWLDARVMRDKTYQATPLGPDIVAFLREQGMRLSPRTLDQYERDLRLIALAVSSDVAGVDKADLLLVLEVVPEGSRHRVRSAWSEFFAWAIREGKRPDNPEARLPKRRSRPVPVYSDLYRPEEIERLIAAVGRLEHPLAGRLRVLTQVETGARAAELRGIRLNHYDLFSRQVTVTGKGGKTRLVPITPRLANLVDEYLLTPYPEPIAREPLPSDFVWYAVRKMGERVLTFTPERQLGYGAFWRWWVKVENEAGVRHRKPHMTRHTLATDILDATGDAHAAKEILGHASIRTTETYLHSTRGGAKRNAIDAVAAWRQGEAVEL